MVQLGLLHYIYVLMVVIVLITMAFKKDVVLPCIVGLFVMGVASTGSLVKGIQVIYNSLIAAGNEFWGIIVIISLVVAMSKSLKDLGADELMMKPIKKLMINRSAAFWGLGMVMLVVSWFIWPSPAVALIGAIMLPAAIKAGLPAIWAAVAINLFGHGIALSSDYFIQGAPAITAQAAGIESALDIMSASIPIWATMSVVTVLTSFILMRRDLKGYVPEAVIVDNPVKADRQFSKGTYFVAIFTPIVFIADMFIMLELELKGGDATALVGGTAVLVMTIVSVIRHNLKNSLEKVTEYVREGFLFGIKVFAPVIVIGAFFFLGSEGMAKQILGDNASGFLNDIGIFLSNNVPLSKVPVIIIQALVGGITGLDGSGFSGLPLVGSLAQTFSSAITINKEGLAALGQLTAVWVGGGTVIPWAVIPVAAICNVNPLELARKNLIPVMTGFAAAAIVAMFIF